MAEIEQLVETKELSFNWLSRLAQGEESVVFFAYDPEVDILIFLTVRPEEDKTVHFVDENVALLYRPESREVIGLQVEAFERNFLAKHAEVGEVWRLSDAVDAFKDVGDLILKVEQVKPRVAQEVARVTEDLLRGRSGDRDLIPT